MSKDRNIKPPENQILVIFGASGDLTKRKLIPALFDLEIQGLLPKHFAILGVGRTKLTDEAFRQNMTEALHEFTDSASKKGEKIISFTTKLYYESINTSEESDYEILKNRIALLTEESNLADSIIFYLATPPKLYPVIPKHLASWGLNIRKQKHGCRRLIIEKPFGTDLASGVELNKQLLEFFREEQIYRIDHYLGKETVQNLLVTRFANGIFEPLWNRNYIHHVEITSVENIGVENRGGYYDHSGALRDMVQNHLLQLVGMVAMEPPTTIDSNAIRNEMVKVFQALRPLTFADIRHNVIRGQYGSSTIRGRQVKGYRMEEGVDPDSRTETFVAMKFFIDNWRWGGVPFYIRTGKNLPTRVTEIVIHFKRTPHHLFRNLANVTNAHNQLVIRIQPDEGILMKFGLKIPGTGFEVQPVNMDFHYDTLKEHRLPSAYERLLLDAMHGDSTLYARGDAVEAAWKFVQPILDAWAEDKSIPVYGYPAGTWGPEIADQLIEEEYITWRYPCKNLALDGEYCEL
ncbi:MAG: glucose-6-phosphate dehydrogenase [Bacteroidota bacterium]